MTLCSQNSPAAVGPSLPQPPYSNRTSLQVPTHRTGMRTSHTLLAALALTLLAGGHLVLALPASASDEVPEAAVHGAGDHDGPVKGHDGNDPAAEHSGLPKGHLDPTEESGEQAHDGAAKTGLETMEDDHEDETASADSAPASPPAKHPVEAAKVMSELDTNHDGKISRDELVARLKQVHDKCVGRTRPRASSPALLRIRCHCHNSYCCAGA